MTGRDDEQRLTADIIELARQYDRYGYRKVAELLRQAGWIINDNRVERIWRREGLKAPPSNPSAADSGWPTDRALAAPAAAQSCLAYDFLEDCTHDGRKYRMPNARRVHP